ncbi:MAG: hypothetical protein ABFS86_17095 [Planctomycetota bacterium]
MRFCLCLALLLGAGPAVRGTVTDADGKPLAADVWVDVKSWPDGKFKLTPHHAKAGKDGAFDIDISGAATGNWFVNVAATAKGHAFVSRYEKAPGVPDFSPKLPKGHPVTLRILDADGKPMPPRTGVRPGLRKTAGGDEHRLYYDASVSLGRSPDKKGCVKFDCFAKGDRGTVLVTFARVEEEREFVVEGKKNEVIVLAPAKPTPSETLTAGKDPNKKYFLYGPKPAEKQPKPGYGLILVMPGGTGNATFANFVKSIYEETVPEGYVMAQLVAFKWQAGQKIVWPTERDRVKGAKFTTEEFIDAVVKDVAKRVKVDRKRIFTLSWSSGGPAAYAAAFRKRTPITGSFVVMSVFYRAWYPSLSAAKGRSFYILHSPTDQTCRFPLAEDARDQLRKAGAVVEFATYEGGHGWPPATRTKLLRTGFKWLDTQ